MKQFDEICRDRLDEMERKGELTPRVVAHLRAEMERTTPRVESYAYRSPTYGACVWDDPTLRHYTAQEYDEHLHAICVVQDPALNSEQGA